MYISVLLVAREKQLKLREDGLMFLFTSTFIFLRFSTKTSVYTVLKTACLATNIGNKISIL